MSGVRDYSPWLDGRLCLVVDDQVAPPVAAEMERLFGNLPFTLTDVDRPDTAHVRHFVHRFGRPEGEEPNRVVAFVVERARALLAQRGIQAGTLARAYVNLNLHGDHQFAHRDGVEWTALMFVCSQWQPDWGGVFQIYPDDGSSGLSIAIEPRPGRLVLFDGELLHRGGAPSRRFDGPRMSLAVKLAKHARA